MSRIAEAETEEAIGRARGRSNSGVACGDGAETIGSERRERRLVRHVTTLPKLLDTQANHGLMDYPQEAIGLDLPPGSPGGFVSFSIMLAPSSAAGPQHAKTSRKVASAHLAAMPLALAAEVLPRLAVQILSVGLLGASLGDRRPIHLRATFYGWSRRGRLCGRLSGNAATKTTTE
jgi:hypothetical protein